jgi:RNase H-fold protein (predicted Holliday junction resolvase)
MEPGPPLLAIDPGLHKCGVAVVAPDGRVLDRAVIATGEIAEEAADRVARFGCQRVVIGNRTTARELHDRLAARGMGTEVVFVDEHHSTQEGRARYFRENPPRGWRRLIPRGLLTPPVPYDDYVAIILAERYLSG